MATTIGEVRGKKGREGRGGVCWTFPSQDVSCWETLLLPPSHAITFFLPLPPFLEALVTPMASPGMTVAGKWNPQRLCISFPSQHLACRKPMPIWAWEGRLHSLFSIQPASLSEEWKRAKEELLVNNYFLLSPAATEGMICRAMVCDASKNGSWVVLCPHSLHRAMLCNMCCLFPASFPQPMEAWGKEKKE